MLPLGSADDERKPAFKNLDKARAIIPAECIPLWAKGEIPDSLFMVPLHWRRSLEPLPQTHWLDCWYLWNPATEPESWEFHPSRVNDQKVWVEEEQFRLSLLIFKAKIETQTRSHRLHCPHLLSSLAQKGAGGIWVRPERDDSISIWADPTFQLYHGRLE
jgi:hypothetical protein